MKNSHHSSLCVLALAAACWPIPGAQNHALAQPKPKIEIISTVPHSAHILAVAFSPDGKRVLSGSWDRTAKLWDAGTGRLLRTFGEHVSGITSVAFSPLGDLVLSGSADGSIELSDAATGEVLKTFIIRGAFPGIWSLAFSADGTRILSGNDEGWLMEWDAVNGKVLRQLQAHSGRIWKVAYSTDGKRVLTCSRDKTLKLWDARSWRLLRKYSGHTDELFSCALSPDGTRALSGDSKGTLRFWNVERGKSLRTTKSHSGNIHGVAFSPDGSRALSVSGDTTIKLWDVATGQLLRTLEGHATGVWSVAFSPDGTRALSGGEDGTPRLWDIETGRVLQSLTGQASTVYSVAFSRDGTRLVSGRGDKKLQLWDARSGRLLSTFEGHSGTVWSVAFSSDGARLLSGGQDKTLKLWDVVTSHLLRTFEGHHAAVTSVSFSPDGTRALSGSNDARLILWDTNNGQIVHTFHATSSVWHVAFSPDGTRIVSANGDGAVQMWDTATGQLVRNFSASTSSDNSPRPAHSFEVSSVAISPDGSRILSGGLHDNRLKLWDVATGKLLNTFRHEDNVFSVAFSPDGNQLLSSSYDLKLWDASSGKLLRTFGAQTGEIRSVAFSPDAALIASGSGDTGIRFWNATSGQWTASLLGTTVGEWLTITADGFFAASRNVDEMVSTVRGLEVYATSQLFDHLYRPDLIEQIFKGDPEGKYKDAVATLSLEKILDSGPAPLIQRIFERKMERVNDSVTLTLRLVDTGGGIGEKVVWRVNGVTQGDVSNPVSWAPIRSSYRIVSQTLKINPRQKNIIEVVGYNGDGLLATVPFRLEVDKYGETTGHRPRMHILGIGINDYAQKDWQLSYAALDAETLAQALKDVAQGLYETVNVNLLLENEATVAGIERAFNRLANEIEPADVFVMFVAGHGRSIAGTYYFLPQDLKFDGGRTVMSHGVGQDLWQKWLARVPAQKSILVFDTCESAAAAGLTRGDRERETAIDRLEHATGRSVITAARQAAYEGYKGHGILTYTILQALSPLDTQKDDEIDLYQLATHVDREVPIISEQVFGVRQRPHNKIEGNFPIGVRKNVFVAPPDDLAIPKTHTHVVIRGERVREAAMTDAQGERLISPGTQVRVVTHVGTWAFIARDGQKLGYVPVDALLQLH